MSDSVKEEPSTLGTVTRELAETMLRRMMVIRAFEEKIEELYSMGKVHGTMHLSIGQEASAAGLSFALTRDDYLLNTHRGHGHCLAWGSEPGRMMAEFLGKEAGYCRGRGGSMHIADVESNNLGANGIVAGGLPISVGVGMSVKLRKTQQVVAAVFGDGASNEGAFHESLNMASIWKLPVIYYCENNQYAMSMPFSKAVNVENVSDRASAYNIPGVTVDGNDPIAVYEAVSAAVARARAGEGPSLVEAVTYRYRGHSKSDRQAYRTRDEVRTWMDRDPITSFASELGISDEKRAEFLVDANRIIEEAVVFAEAAAEPELSSIMEGVYA